MNAIHLHLLLNHVPVIGAVIGVALLVAALARRSDELGKAALALFVVLAGVSAVVFLTGEPAEELVEKLPGFSEALTHQHEEVAEAALIAMVVVGVFSALGLVVFRKRPMARWVTPAALALSLVAAGLMGYAANLGGMIRHTEIRSTTAVSPVNEGDDMARQVPRRGAVAFSLPLDTIESLGALASRHEAQPWFDAARDALIRQDRESAAIALSDAATFLQKEWDKAPGDARGDLVRAVEELDSLAGVVARGDIGDPRALDRIFARAHAAEASLHLLRANAAILRHEHAGAGDELMMSIDHLERAGQDAGIKRDALVQAAIGDTRSLAGEMMRGMQAVPDEAAKITDEVERAIRRIRTATTRG